MFNRVVTSRDELREIFKMPSERAVLKERRALDEHDRAFIAQSPFLLLARPMRRGGATSRPRATRPASCSCSTTATSSSPTARAITAWTA